MAEPGYRPVYAFSRGGHLESLHYGAITVVNANGELIASLGDTELSTFLRSTAKPFQVLPFVLAGGIEHYGLTPRELALICSSHSGTDEHVAVFRSLQKKTGINEDQLLCGVHPPFHRPTAERLQFSGIPITSSRHNCSGKHIGMLAFAKMRGWPLETYIDPAHPLQKEIFKLFLDLASLLPEKLTIGIDGCSAPNWAAPHYNVALAYARLMDPSSLSTDLATACEKVRNAMTSNADMVGGPERFDTDLMQVANGRLLAKGGAEGYQGIGLETGAYSENSPAIGIALKISDGDSRAWARQAVSLEVLRQVGALSADHLAKLKDHGPSRIVTNWRGLEVGRAEPAFALEKQ